MKEKPISVADILACALLAAQPKPCVVFAKKKKADSKPFPEIKGIYANENKKTVAVALKNDVTKVAKCSPFDSFDLEVGFALAFTRAALGGKRKVRDLLATAHIVKAEEPKLVCGDVPAKQVTPNRGRKPHKAKKQEE